MTGCLFRLELSGHGGTHRWEVGVSSKFTPCLETHPTCVTEANLAGGARPLPQAWQREHRLFHRQRSAERDWLGADQRAAELSAEASTQCPLCLCTVSCTHSACTREGRSKRPGGKAGLGAAASTGVLAALWSLCRRALVWNHFAHLVLSCKFTVNNTGYTQRG